MRLIDTHCHVQFKAYQQDMNDVIERSLQSNVFLITVGTQSETSKKAVEVAEKHSGVWATIGLHPSHTYEHTEEETGFGGVIKMREESFDQDYYHELAQSKKVVAIGECGLEYFHLLEEGREEIKEKQKQIFEKQLNFAHEHNLPVVIHSRDAFEDQIEILKRFLAQGKLARKGVIHCFTGTIEQAQTYIDLGFLLSFTGIITFPPRKTEGNISQLQQVVKDLPLEKIMIETDAPYLSPVPFRGERNEPHRVLHVAEKIAELKNLPLEEVCEQTFKNAVNFFRLDV